MESKSGDDVGEVERIRASLGAAFGHDLGHRVAAAGDRQPKKHDEPSDEHLKEDAVELHEQSGKEPATQVVHLPVVSTDHLDLSA